MNKSGEGAPKRPDSVLSHILDPNLPGGRRLFEDELVKGYMNHIRNFVRFFRINRQMQLQLTRRLKIAEEAGDVAKADHVQAVLELEPAAAGFAVHREKTPGRRGTFWDYYWVRVDAAGSIIPGSACFVVTRDTRGNTPVVDPDFLGEHAKYVYETYLLQENKLKWQPTKPEDMDCNPP